MKKIFFLVIAFLALCQGMFAMGVMDVAFSPDGKRVAYIGAERTDEGILNYMMQFNTSDGSLNGIFYAEYLEMTGNCLAYSPEGRIVAAGTSNTGIFLFDSITGDPIKQLLGHDDSVHSIAFSHDGKTLVSGASDKTIRLWNIASGSENRLIKVDSGVNTVLLTSDGKTIVAALSNGHIKLFDAGNGREIRTLIGHQESVNSIAISPDGRTIVSGSKDNYVKLWDTATGREKVSFVGDKNAVNSVAFSPDGKTFAYGGTGEGSIKICDAITGKEIKKIPGASGMIMCIKFSPDGKTIAQTTLDTVVLWDVASGHFIRTIPQM